MEKAIVNNEIYYTNIKDTFLLHKCINFFNDGCSSYAISFDNKKRSIIHKANIEGNLAYYLRGFNFDKCFIPEKAKDIKNANELLSKGLDLIELL